LILIKGEHTLNDTAELDRRIVEFAASTRFEDLPAQAVRAAQMRVLDSIGVAIAAWDAPPSRIARKLAQPTSGPMAARVWGVQTRTTVDMAAFANGVMVRYLDLNDAWRTRDAHHPSDYLPGILAVAEACGRSGRDFITALAVAYEIMCRFTDVVPLNGVGWDQPVTGVMGTAMGAGLLLGLDREALQHAIALAITPNLCTYQTRSGELSMWKGCAGPNGARNGVFAAQLAAEGLTGPYECFDGVFGFWNQTQQGERRYVPLPDGSADWRWGVFQTNIKTYPVRDSCQLPIMTALKLRAQLDPAAIRSLRIDTYKSAWEGAVKDRELWAPRTRETADHSMLFSVVCTLIDGELSIHSFERERFLDADVLDLIGRTEVVVLDEFTRATPGERKCRITATLADGRTVSADHMVTLAQIEAGMSDQDLEQKFVECTRGIFDEKRQVQVIEATRNLATAGRVDDLIDLIRVS
jgi:2-methylcitrate dehydratase